MALARAHGVELRDLRLPPAGLNVPTGANLDARRDDGPHRRLRLRDREDDRLARARPRGAPPRDRERVRADRPDRHRDRRLGDLGRRGRRPTSSPAPPSSSSSRASSAGASCCSSRARARCCIPAYSGVTLGLIHGSAPHAYVLCHQAGRPSSTTTSASRCRRSPSSSTLHERISLLARPARVHAIALNTRHLDEDAARAAIEAAEAETGLPADDPVRFGAGAAARRARRRAPRQSRGGSPPNRRELARIARRPFADSDEETRAAMAVLVVRSRSAPLGARRRRRLRRQRQRRPVRGRHRHRSWPRCAASG